MDSIEIKEAQLAREDRETVLRGEVGRSGVYRTGCLELHTGDIANVDYRSVGGTTRITNDILLSRRLSNVGTCCVRAEKSSQAKVLRLVAWLQLLPLVIKLTSLTKRKGRCCEGRIDGVKPLVIKFAELNQAPCSIHPILRRELCERTSIWVISLPLLHHDLFSLLA